jgi:hypothetical protein
MKTASAYLINLIRAATRLEHVVYVKTGTDLEYPVKRIERNMNHTIVFELARGGGFLAIAPDAITAVRLMSMPAPAGDEAI